VKSLFQLLAEVSIDLQGYSWALIGGLAVGIRTEPRFTRDIDLAVKVENDSQAEQLIFSLRARKYRIAAVLEQASRDRLATVRLLPPDDDRLIDLLFFSTGIEAMVVGSAQELELSPGFSAPVAKIGHLIAMKILARDDRKRPQDRLDLKALLQSCEQSDLNQAREALTEIEKVGLNRERDLIGSLAETLEEFR